MGERKRSIEPVAVADPELVERASRRRFTAEYKLRLVTEAEACTEPGEVGALLRREGLYSSHLRQWCQAREVGAVEALERPWGRRRAGPCVVEIEALRRRAERAEGELVTARKVIEVEGKVSALLDELLKPASAQDQSSGR